MAVRKKGNVYRIGPRKTDVVGLSESGQAVGYVTPNPYISIQEQYRQLAKQADERLVRLEKLVGTEYENALDYSYASARRDIKGAFGENARRFNRKLPDNVASQQKMLRAVQKFLNSPTSTKTGITSIYKHKADILNKEYGTNFKWQDLKDYFDKVNSKVKADRLASKTFLVSLGQTMEDPEAVIESIKETIAQVTHSDNEEDKDEKIAQYLEGLNLSLDDLSSKKPAVVGEVLHKLSTTGKYAKEIKDTVLL